MFVGDSKMVYDFKEGFRSFFEVLVEVLGRLWWVWFGCYVYLGVNYCGLGNGVFLSG